jgi:hypothetical protein
MRTLNLILGIIGSILIVIGCNLEAIFRTVTIFSGGFIVGWATQ